MAALPEAFVQRMRAQLASDDEFAAFLAALDAPPPVTIRRNRRKPSDAFASAVPVPWCPDTGRYLAERPVFALDPLWHAGAYYVQEASSMLVDWALRQHADRTRPNLRALDLCAAPGGKTTLLADTLPDDALLVANEAIRGRVPMLTENLARWGWPNSVVTNADPEAFAHLPGLFDIVLVDAPCSGEGLFRKDAGAAGEWSVENADRCAARQQRILAAARSLVSPEGGLLLYSTCTYNPDENDDAVEGVLGAREGYEALPLATDAPAEWGLAATRYGVQCYPHRVRGEGFYLAALRRTVPAQARYEPETRAARPRTALPEAARALLEEPERFVQDDGAPAGMIKALPEPLARLTYPLPNVRSFGLLLGTSKGRDLVPAHELALSTARRRALPTEELSLEDARRYLRKEPFADDLAPSATGWVLPTYHGFPLGWIKALMDGRVNNYLPNEWRLRLTTPRA